jgi:hypothetical protein
VNSFSRATPAARSFGLRAASLASVLVALGIALTACSSTVEKATASGGGGEGGDATTTAGVGSTGTGGATNASSSGAGAGGDPWSGPLQSLTELDLGDVPLNVLTSVPIPDRALGLTVLVEAPSLTELIGLARLRPPSGGSVIYNYAMADHQNQVFANFGWIGGSNPQSDSADAWPVQSGTWKILLGDDDGSIKSGHVRVWVRRTQDGAFHGGVVDVNVFLAPGQSQKYVTTVLGNIFADYGGISLGNVSVFPLDAAFQTIDNNDEYRKMLASSAGAGTVPALNLFVIGSFGPDFGQAIGVAGGIPGSPMLHGTTMSGVAYQPSGNPQYDATVLRHEIGHLAGLFHTTEYATLPNSNVHETDPLSDTAVCVDATIESNPANCPDKTNTMFPIAYGATALTPGQVRVLQGSALYRGIIEAGGQPSPPLPFAPGTTPPAELVSEVAQAAAVQRPDKPMPASPTPLERVLGGVWCAHGGADHEALAVRLAGEAAPSVLRSIVLDEGAAELMRARALGAYVRASVGEERARAVELCDALARKPSASTDLRVAALRALARISPSKAEPATAEAAQSGDVVVRAVALRLRTR